MTVGLSPVLRWVTHGVYAYWCPGCSTSHSFDVTACNDDGKRVGWDGDLKKPTVEPELTFPGCRHLMRAGELHFSAVCTHGLAGQKVPIPVFPLPNP